MGSLLSQLFTGLGIGATLLLIALGLTFTFGQMNVINMAHGEFIMAGAYTAYLLQGRRMRAVMQNRQLAACSGIPTARVDRRTFFIGSGLAGVAGVALTQLGSIGPTLGTNYIVDAFLVVVVGGLGQIRGAVIAAIALGVLDAYVEWGTSASFAKVVVFVAIVAFLQARPQGLFVLKTRALT